MSLAYPWKSRSEPGDVTAGFGSVNRPGYEAVIGRLGVGVAAIGGVIWLECGAVIGLGAGVVVAIGGVLCCEYEAGIGLANDGVVAIGWLLCCES